MSYDTDKKVTRILRDKLMTAAKTERMSEYELRELMIALDDELERRKLVKQKVAAITGLTNGRIMA